MNYGTTRNHTMNRQGDFIIQWKVYIGQQASFVPMHKFDKSNISLEITFPQGRESKSSTLVRK